MLSFCITAKLYIFTADMKCIIIKLINMGGGGYFLGIWKQCKSYLGNSVG